MKKENNTIREAILISLVGVSALTVSNAWNLGGVEISENSDYGEAIKLENNARLKKETELVKKIKELKEIDVDIGKQSVDLGKVKEKIKKQLKRKLGKNSIEDYTKAVKEVKKTFKENAESLLIKENLSKKTAKKRIATSEFKNIIDNNALSVIRGIEDNTNKKIKKIKLGGLNTSDVDLKFKLIVPKDNVVTSIYLNGTKINRNSVTLEAGEYYLIIGEEGLKLLKNNKVVYSTNPIGKNKIMIELSLYNNGEPIYVGKISTDIKNNKIRLINNLSIGDKGEFKGSAKERLLFKLDDSKMEFGKEVIKYTRDKKQGKLIKNVTRTATRKELMLPVDLKENIKTEYDLLEMISDEFKNAFNGYTFKKTILINANNLIYVYQNGANIKIYKIDTSNPNKILVGKIYEIKGTYSDISTINLGIGKTFLLKTNNKNIILKYENGILKKIYETKGNLTNIELKTITGKMGKVILANIDTDNLVVLKYDTNNDVIYRIFKGKFDKNVIKSLKIAGNLDNSNNTEEYYHQDKNFVAIFQYKQYSTGKPILSLIYYSPRMKIYFNKLLTKAGSDWKVLFGLPLDNNNYVRPVLTTLWFDEDKGVYYIKQKDNYSSYETFDIKIDGNYVYKKENNVLDESNTDKLN